MNKAKVILFAVVVAVIFVATIPWWGSCDLNARLCSTWCSVKHMTNDSEASGCRGRCLVKKARCHGDEAAKGLKDFMNGLQSE